MTPNYGFTLNSTLIAPSLLKGLGASIVGIDYERTMTQADISLRVKTYQSAKMGVYVLAHRIQDVIWLHKTFKVGIMFLNEPDAPDQDRMTPQAVVDQYSYLYSLGIKVYGPNAVSPVFADSVKWQAEFRELGGYKYVRACNHGYGGLPQNVELVGEAGPVDGTPLAQWIVQTIPKLTCPTLFYRGPNPIDKNTGKRDGTGLIDDASGAWTVVNTEGVALVKALAAASIN